MEVHRKIDDASNYDREMNEAIDTVIAELEKPLQTNEDVETWNAAIDAAAENAEAYRGLVDKQSILKLKKIGQ